MAAGPGDGYLLEGFNGAQRAGVGDFTADPCSGEWSGADPVHALFGLEPRAGAPTWSAIVERIPDDERPMVQDAWEQARTRIGAFSWSHRIQAADGQVRSVLVVGETSERNPGGGSATVVHRESRPASPSALVMRGYVLDLTDLRRGGARSAADDAVEASAAHRAVIEQAKGVLMLGYGLSAEAAFALLAWRSQNTNRKVHVIATDLLARLSDRPATTAGLRHALDLLIRSTEDGAEPPGPDR